jgi:hypothetical protein
MAHFYIPIRSDPHHPGELFPCVGFIVTNPSLPSGSVVRFYNKRGLQFMGLYKFHGVRYRMVNEAVADSASSSRAQGGVSHKVLCPSLSP